jgi:hypothetical protein
LIIPETTAGGRVKATAPTAASIAAGNTESVRSSFDHNVRPSRNRNRAQAVATTVTEAPIANGVAPSRPPKQNAAAAAIDVPTLHDAHFRVRVVAANAAGKRATPFPRS